MSYTPIDQNQDHRAIAQELEAMKTVFEMTVLNVSPVKLKAGMMVYADGVNFNPGAGEGVYRRDKTNTNWVLVG